MAVQSVLTVAAAPAAAAGRDLFHLIKAAADTNWRAGRGHVGLPLPAARFYLAQVSECPCSTLRPRGAPARSTTVLPTTL